MKRKKVKVFVYLSVWEEGHEFEGGAVALAFGTEEEALKQLKAGKKEALKRFKDNYDKDDISISECQHRIEINANYYSDCWTGEIYEQDIYLPAE